MSITMAFWGCILPLMTVSAISLSVCRGVGGCLCPNSLSMILIYTASHAMMYSPASSALVSDDFLIMCAMWSTPLLFGGTVVSLERNKCPPALLCALGLLK